LQFPSFLGQNLTFWENPFLHQWTKLPNWQNLQKWLFKKQFKRMWPRRSQDPQTSQRDKCIQPPKTVQKECTDSDGVNYARPLKVSKAERFFIRCSYTCVLIFMPFLGFQQKANTCLWPIPSKHRQYNFQWYLTSA
jgi:hypothetical protein